MSKDKFICKRCGKCCLTVPCVFAQVKYNIHKGSTETCPELVKDESGLYKCLLIERDIEVREILISGDCDDPKLAHLKEKIDASSIVREYFPKANDYILWGHTSFPNFWNIPRDGWTSTQCLRTQLAQLKEKVAAV